MISVHYMVYMARDSWHTYLRERRTFPQANRILYRAGDYHRGCARTYLRIARDLKGTVSEAKRRADAAQNARITAWFRESEGAA